MFFVLVLCTLVTNFKFFCSDVFELWVASYVRFSLGELFIQIKFLLGQIL